MDKKIFKLSEIDIAAQQWQGKTSTLVGGCFDIVHYGHVTFLNEAKKQADILIIALESDEFIQQRKKRTPIHTQQQRAEILAALESVDIIIQLPLINSNEEYAQMVQNIKPTIIAITEGDQKLSLKKEQADSISAQLVVIPAVPSLSTSSILSYAHS